MRLAIVLLLCAPAGLAACATTADDVHDWGYNGQFERIRKELRLNPPEDIRAAAAVELGKGRYPWAIPDLAVLSQDPSPDVRLAATEALGSYAGREVYSAILQRCADDNRNVASAAERILRTWGSESIEILLEAVTDRSFRVRAAAVQVLGRMADSRVGPTLLERAKQDDNSMVRREAVKALGNLGYAKASKDLYVIKNTDTSAEVGMEAERALAKMGGTVVQAKVAVFPLCDCASGLDGVAEDLLGKLREAMVAGNLCGVIVPAGLAAGSGRSVDAAVQAAKGVGAGQVVHLGIQREDVRLKAVISRVDAQSGALLQQETAVGFEADPSKLVDEAVDRFLRRFE